MTRDELLTRLLRLPWGEDGVPAPLNDAIGVSRRRYRLIAGEPPGRLEFLLLAALAISGWSARIDLIQVINNRRGLQPRSGSYRRAIEQLDKSGLWITQIASFNYRKIALVRLTERGVKLLQDAGVPVVPSEWERVEQQHWIYRDRCEMTMHTAAICTFLHHARLRGYETEACPTVDHPLARPDALAARPGLKIYVEVQNRGGTTWRKAAKWRNQADWQGFAAICALTPNWALRLARQAQAAGVTRGLVTDLSTLVTQAPATLWTHRWLSLYSPPEPAPDNAPESWLQEVVYTR